jgi:hypothetical protein
MTILQIDGGSGEITLPLLDCLSRPEGRLLNRFHFASISKIDLEEAKIRLQDWEAYIDYKTLDISRDPVEQGFIKDTYDLIIAPATIQGAISLELTATHIRSMLKAEGRFMIVNSPKFMPADDTSDEETGVLVESHHDESLVLSENQWHGVLSTCGFEGAVLVGDPIGMSSVVVSKAIDAASLELGTEKQVQILSTTQSSAILNLINELSSSLKRLGMETSAIGWPIHMDNNSSCIYVVVDDVQNALLVDPADEQYLQVMDLLLTGKTVMWISIQEECTSTMDSSKGMITGLARVARKETGVKIVTVDIQQSVTNRRSELVEALSRILVNTFAPSYAAARATEYEISYKDNQVLIPRISADANFNHWIDKGKDSNELELGFYQQQKRPLKLHVGTPGILSSLQFIDDELARSTLQPDELEISARAYGVNFKEVSGSEILDLDVR